MSPGTVFVKSFAIIDGRGIATPKGRIRWDEGQTGPADVRRAQVLPAPYVAFGKLNLPDRLAFSAASLALRDGPGERNNRMGVFLAIPGGSLSTDRAYRASVEQGNPSPALFSATLPSSPIADIAIYHQLTGPNIVFAGGDSPFFAALEYVLLMMECGRLDEALVVLVDEPVETEAHPQPSATALLVGTSPGSVSFELSREPPESPLQQDQPSTLDTVLCITLCDALEKSGSLRMPVCAGGFKGYICLKLS